MLNFVVIKCPPCELYDDPHDIYLISYKLPYRGRLLVESVQNSSMVKAATITIVWAAHIAWEA